MLSCCCCVRHTTQVRPHKSWSRERTAYLACRVSHAWKRNLRRQPKLLPHCRALVHAGVGCTAVLRAARRRRDRQHAVWRQQPGEKDLTSHEKTPVPVCVRFVLQACRVCVRPEPVWVKRLQRTPVFRFVTGRENTCHLVPRNHHES